MSFWSFLLGLTAGEVAAGYLLQWVAPDWWYGRNRRFYKAGGFWMIVVSVATVAGLWATLIMEV